MCAGGEEVSAKLKRNKPDNLARPGTAYRDEVVAARVVHEPHFVDGCALVLLITEALNVYLTAAYKLVRLPRRRCCNRSRRTRT